MIVLSMNAGLTYPHTLLSRFVHEWSEPYWVILAHYTTPTLVHHYTTVPEHG
jgi:hypothetical protein